MTTRTELANRALAHLGEQGITDIDDTTSKPARVCSEFASSVIDEILRLHRWNCAIDRATLSELETAPDHGFERAFQLPSDFIRLLEVNGEAFDEADEFFELEAGQRLLTDEDTAEIRYVKRIDVAEMDPLLAKTVALALAVEIAVPLTLNSKLKDALEEKLIRDLSRAARVDAQECGARENRPLERLRAQSPLIRARCAGTVYDPTRFRIP